MASLDVFHQDAFTTIQLTAAVDKVPYLPDELDALDLFEPFPIRTKALAIEERDGALKLIKTSPRGSPATERTTENRLARYFTVPRLRHGDTVYAEEVEGIREFGQETELMQVSEELGRRLNGPTGILQNLRYTEENMRLGCIQGILIDADGSIIYNFFNEFGITQPAEIGFNLAAAVLNTLRPLCNEIVRGMARASKGSFTRRTQVWGYCGDTFWDQFVNHPDVIRTYVNWTDATQIRDGSAGNAWQMFSFGGINWYNYRGSDDATTIAVQADKVKFFPRYAPGIFRKAMSPGESIEWVNQLGRPQYTRIIFDRDRNEWVRAEVSEYPLFICTRPEVLWSGRAEV